MTARESPPGSAGSELTERILSRLPGPRMPWVLLWGALAVAQGWLIAAVVPRTSEASVLAAEPVGIAITAYVTILSLVAARFLVVHAQGLAPVLEEVAAPEATAGRLFGASTAGGVPSPWPW